MFLKLTNFDLNNEKITLQQMLIPIKQDQIRKGWS